MAQQRRIVALREGLRFGPVQTKGSLFLHRALLLLHLKDGKTACRAVAAEPDFSPEEKPILLFRKIPVVQRIKIQRADEVPVAVAVFVRVQHVGKAVAERVILFEGDEKLLLLPQHLIHAPSPP